MQRVRRAVARFWGKGYEDNLTGLAAMVAYSLLLSLFPVALIALFIAGRVLRSDEVTQSVLYDLQRLFPSATEADLRSALRSVRSSSPTAGVLALVGSAWVAASFWGALDTAFCRIYQLPCRSWVRQKLFGFGMLLVILILIAASVVVPTVQSLLVSSAKDLPFGLAATSDVVYWATIALGLCVLFVALCITYAAVPKGAIPWACVWPGALGATLAAGVLDFVFPIYISQNSTLRIGTSAVFVLIALIWFYILALIVLSGAVINELRLQSRRAGSAASPVPPATTSRPAARAPTAAVQAPAGRSDGEAGESGS